MSTFDFEAFNTKAYIKEVREFMDRNGISAREWARLSGSSVTTLKRLERKENDMTIGLGKKFQRIMKAYDLFS